MSNVAIKKARFILKEMQIRNENIVQRTETKHSIKTNDKHSTPHVKPLQNENVWTDGIAHDRKDSHQTHLKTDYCTIYLIIVGNIRGKRRLSICQNTLFKDGLT